MSTPDLTSYVDLRIYDKDAQEVFDYALELVKISLPEWEPAEGNTEVVLLEAMAQQVAEAIFAINRLPGAITQILLRLYGITRDDGLPPVATVQFNLADGLGHDIPAGTRLRLDLPSGLEPVVFLTDVALSVPVGSNSGTVTVTANRNTIDANGTAIGTRLEILDAIAYVNSVELTTEVTSGADEETDEEWYTRGTQRFDRLSDTLVVPQHFVSAALERSEVKRAFALDNYDPTADAGGDGPVGNDPGHVTVAVYGDGATLTAPQKADIETDFEAISLANLDVHVIDPTITSVDVTVTVVKISTYDSTTVTDNITARLNDYLSPDSWEWGGTVYLNELISVIDQVEGVARVTSITTPATDFTLAGVAPLADAGTITVTVT